MTSLLSVPEEIRGIIFTTVLYSVPTPSSDNNYVSFSTEEAEYNRESSNQYPEDLPILPYSILIQINKQIHSEVKEIIKKEKVKYKLEVKIEGNNIYPKWILLPVIESKVDTVDVNLRMTHLHSIHDGWSSGCRCCTGGPGTIIWSLAALLLRFVQRGPDFLSPVKPDFSVKDLIINIVNSFPPPEEDQKKPKFMFPEKLQQILPQEIEYLLNPTENDKKAKAMFNVVQGKLECVKLTYDCKLVKEWKVSKQ